MLNVIVALLIAVLMGMGIGGGGFLVISEINSALDFSSLDILR